MQCARGDSMLCAGAHLRPPSHSLQTFPDLKPKKKMNAQTSKDWRSGTLIYIYIHTHINYTKKKRAEKYIY